MTWERVIAMISSCIVPSHAAISYAQHTAGVTFADAELLAYSFAGAYHAACKRALPTCAQDNSCSCRLASPYMLVCSCSQGLNPN